MCLIGCCVSIPMLSYSAGAPVMDIQGEATGAYRKAQAVVHEIQGKLTKDSQENIEKAKTGDAACGDSPDATKKRKSMTAEVFKYIYDEVLDNPRDEANIIIEPKSSYAKNRQNVKETFYAMGNEDSGLTEMGEKLNEMTTDYAGINLSQKGYSASDVEKARKNREEYASQVAGKNLKIAVELREKVSDDLKSIGSTETKGCNQLQGHLYENRGMGTLIKGTAADIVVQILTLESLGAKLMLKDDAGFLPVPKDPNEDEEDE